MGTGSFPGGKVRPERAADHSPPSSVAVMEEYSYNSTHHLGQTGPVMGSLYLYLKTNHIGLPAQYSIPEDGLKMFKSCRRQEELNYVNLKNALCWLTLRNRP